MPETKIAPLLQKMVKGSRRVLYNQLVARDSTFKMNVVLNWGKEYDEASSYGFIPKVTTTLPSE